MSRLVLTSTHSYQSSEFKKKKVSIRYRQEACPLAAVVNFCNQVVLLIFMRGKQIFNRSIVESKYSTRKNALPSVWSREIRCSFAVEPDPH